MDVASTLFFLGLILVADVVGLMWVLFERRPSYKEFAGMFGLGFLEVFINMICSVAGNVDTILLLESLYYLGSTVQLMFVWTLVWDYSIKSRNKKIFSLVGIIGDCDIILMLTNIKKNTVFTVEMEPTLENGNNYVLHHQYPGAYIHFGILIIFSLFTLTPLVYKYIVSRGVYRNRYGTILFVFLIATMVGLSNGYLNLNKLILQSSNVLIVFACYFVMCHLSPEQLTKITIHETLRNLNSGLCVFDAEGHIIESNELVFDFLHLNRGDVEALKIKLDEILAVRDARNKDRDSWMIEIPNLDNSVRYVKVDSGRIKDRHDELIGHYINVSDRTQEQITLQAEHFKATHDELTGLLNKEGFYEAASERMRKYPEDDYIVICTNVRDFKMVNDLFGFDKGNEIIQKMGAMLSMALHKEELLGRTVADQFAILSRKSIYDEFYFLDQLRGITNIITSSYYTMTIHCGVYEVSNHEMDVSLMCDRANMAISTISDFSENKIAVYDDEMMSTILHDRQVANHLDRAVARNEFLIYLQPQVDPEGRPLGAEALVRWNDPGKGILAPGAFISILEKTGCLYKLDLHVWELAARQLCDWKGTVFENLHISVNISPKDFYYLDIYKIFTGLVDRYKIDPAKLKLEITESALMNEPDRQFKIINRLHNVGFEFEIDDFGTGYSSLSMLKDMPADVLKIDMEFLHETENRERSRMILDSVISLAHQLDMKVITEGVEKKSQVEFLRDMGCSIFQGYYFSKPLPVDEFEEKYVGMMKH